MVYKLIIREVRLFLFSGISLLMLLLATTLTISSGLEFASRKIPFASTEWAYRSSFAAVGFFLLATTVAVWYHISRDQRFRMQELVFSHPISTPKLILAKQVAMVISTVLIYKSGITLGVVLTGWRTGLWPAFRILERALFVNNIPGIIAWIMLTSALSLWLKELKTLVFPVAALWMILYTFPQTSLFSIQPPFDGVLWGQIGRSILLLTGAVLWCNILIGRERNGVTAGERRRSQRRFGVQKSAFWGKLWLDLKISLGKKMLISVACSIGLSFILFGPWGPGANSSPQVRQFFGLAFSEFFFPLLGLMIAGDILTRDENLLIRELILSLPNGGEKLLVQKLTGLSAFLFITSTVYALSSSLLVRWISFSQALLVIFPPMLLISSLVIWVDFITKKRYMGYGTAIFYWFGAYLLEERFPWFLSPLYHLSEYNFKLGQDLLLANKLIITLISALALAFVLLRNYKKPVK